MTRMTRLLLSVVLLGLISIPAVSQESAKAKVQSDADSVRQDAHFYRLDYTVRELDGNKVLSKRTYTTGVRTDNTRRELRTGTRVPVLTGSTSGEKVNTQYQYIDVGVNIDSRAQEVSDGLSVEVTADMSSIAPPETSTNGVSNQVGAPLIRQVRGNATVTVSPNKPTLVFAADEPTSSHRFELELVATRVK